MTPEIFEYIFQNCTSQELHDLISKDLDYHDLPANVFVEYIEHLEKNLSDGSGYWLIKDKSDQTQMGDIISTHYPIGFLVTFRVTNEDWIKEIKSFIDAIYDLGIRLGFNPSAFSTRDIINSNSGHPWEKIPIEKDRLIVESWWKGFSNQKIGEEYNLSKEYVKTKICVLRKIYSEAVVPYDKHRTK